MSKFREVDSPITSRNNPLCLSDH